MNRLQTRISGGEPPDVMSIHGAFYVPLAAKGALADLGPFIAADGEFDLNDFFPRLMELCRYEGKLYSLARYTSVYAMFHNKDLFDQAGQPYPATGQGEWDWQAYRNAAVALTKDLDGDGQPDQWGCAVDFWEARLYPWLWQNGADVFNADRTRCVIDSPAAIEALTFLWELRHTYHVTPASSSQQRSLTLEQFSQGNIGMFMSGPWDVQTLKKNEGLHWDVAPLPKQKQRATILGTENYAISAKTAHPQEAWELLEFLLSPQSQAFMADRLDKMPSRLSVAQGPYAKAHAGYDRRVFVEAVDYARQPPNIPEWSEIRHYLTEQLDRAWVGEISPAEAGREAAAKVNAFLAEERRPGGP
jgi:multiple sugar transport system substrate-binding protein